MAKAPPKIAEEERPGIIKALCGSDTAAGTSVALHLRELEQRWPEVYDATVEGLANTGFLLGRLVEGGSPYTENIAKTVMACRRQIIRELEIRTAAEYMLLDAAMDAYTHWLELSSLVRLSFKDGTNDSKAKHQARLAGMAQSYLRTYMDAMKTLTDMKQPPIRVLKVQAGQTVAVQVNEQPADDKRRHVLEGPPHVERRDLPESAPADATPPAADHG